MRPIRLLIPILCVAAFIGCGQGGPASAQSPAQGGAAAAGRTHYDPNAPLRADDIALYLSVMRAAADRVRHPTAADRAAIQRTKADAAANSKLAAANQPIEAELSAAMQASQAAARRGDFDAARAAQTKAIQLGKQLRQPVLDEPAADIASAFQSGQADRLIVQERHIDSDRYDRIVSRVEDAVPNPYAAVGSGDGGDVMTAAQRQAEAKYEAALATWREQLASDRSEIAALEKVVREPHYGP
jgi:hypothetical protein